MERTPQLVWPPQGFVELQSPVTLTPALWARINEMSVPIERTAVTDLVYGESLDPASKSLRAVEGLE